MLDVLDYEGLSHFHDKEMEEFDNYPNKEEYAFVNRKFKWVLERFNGQAWETLDDDTAGAAKTVPSGAKVASVGRFSGMSSLVDGELVHADVQSIVSRDSSNNVLATFAIPSEIKELEGYGQSSGMDANVVDLDNKVYHEKGHYVSGTWTAHVQDIDLAEFLTDDVLFEVAAGGSVTFVQQTGTQALPNIISYAIELANA